MANETLIDRTTAAIRAAHSACEPSDYTEIEAIADEAADMRAATPAEALLQACILAGELDRDGDHGRMEKLAAALVTYIERSAGLDRTAYGFEFYTVSGAN